MKEEKKQSTIKRLEEQIVGVFRWVKNQWSFILVVILLLFLAWITWETARLDNLGFDGYIDPKGEYHRGKTYWDWMELLIIPIVLAMGAWWLNRSERENEREIAERNREEDRKIADERRNQATLEAYFDRMTELLLEKGLRESKEGDEVQSIARTRTLAVLRSLDGQRKGQVIQFLYESGLIDREQCMVKLSGANLQGADLGFSNLVGVNMHGANLCEANLFAATLSEANLGFTNLTRANLSMINLSEAILHWATLDEADLTGANLIKVNLHGANLHEADLFAAKLMDVNLSKPDLSAEMIGDLDRIDLSGANLSTANLSRADLSGADLSNARLLLANLTEANLSGADLSGAKLCRTDLARHDLTEADLSGANLNEANMTDAKVTDEQLAQARSLIGATLPDGTKVPDEATADEQD